MTVTHDVLNISAHDVDLGAAFIPAHEIRPVDLSVTATQIAFRKHATHLVCLGVTGAATAEIVPTAPSEFSSWVIVNGEAVMRATPLTEMISNGPPVGYEFRVDDTAGSTAADTQSGNDGTYHGAPGFEVTPAPQGTGVHLDGTAWIVAATGADTVDDVDDDDAVTFEGWFRLDALPAEDVIMSVMTKHTKLSVGDPFSEISFWIIGQASGNPNTWVQFGAGGFATSDHAYDTDWHHWALVKDGLGGSELYLDGESVSGHQSSDATWTPDAVGAGSTGAVYGASDAAGANPFVGDMDEIVFHTAALGAGEIKAHHAAGRGNLALS